MSKGIREEFPRYNNQSESAAATRKESFRTLFELLNGNGDSVFSPESLTKFYSLANKYFARTDSNLIFSKLVSDYRPVIREKKMDCDTFVECMEKYHSKIESNVERSDIHHEIQQHCLQLLETNTDCALSMLDLPPDLTQDEISQLLDAMQQSSAKK